MKNWCLTLITLVTLFLPTMASTTHHEVRATKYYPNHNCGMVTADGSKINIRKVHIFEHRWVALSRDMFKKGFKLGDRIWVESDNPLIRGVWIVKDKMGPKKRNSIDFLMTRGNSVKFKNPCKVKIKKL